MSVKIYLEDIAQHCVINASEREAINTSIVAIQNRLEKYYEDNIRNHFQFGSSTRGTMLPKEIDEEADIDYMVVFTNNQYQPQSYLDSLKRFVECYYSRSEIHQSHPTIVLKLNHIKFELVPAISSRYGYQIPIRSSDYQYWQNTDPLSFKKNLEQLDNYSKGLIRKLIRIMKYWNISHGKIFESYKLEENIVSTFGNLPRDYNIDIKDMLFFYVNQINIYDSAISVTDRHYIEELKEKIELIKLYENLGYINLVEQELTYVFPKL